MTDHIRAKFEQLHPNKEGSNQRLREALYAVFKEGWENGQANAANPLEGTTERRYGFCITVIESEAGRGYKPDGYMVGFTIEDLKERQKDFESGNDSSYGLYYARPNAFTPVELTAEGIAALIAASDKHCTVWFDKPSQFMKGEEE